MKTHELVIEGMTCAHCVMAVKKELMKVPQLRVDDVQIGRATVSYEGDTIEAGTLRKIILDAGYTLSEVRS